VERTGILCLLVEGIWWLSQLACKPNDSEMAIRRLTAMAVRNLSEGTFIWAGA